MFIVAFVDNATTFTTRTTEGDVQTTRGDAYEAETTAQHREGKMNTVFERNLKESVIDLQALQKL